MGSLASKSPEQVQHLQQLAAAHFSPLFLTAALKRLSSIKGEAGLDEFERDMINLVEDREAGEVADFPFLREFAVEQLYQAVREAKEAPYGKHALEDISKRRTHGRSEEPATLEEQLQSGLEDSFPASDPPAVVSSTISGGKDKSKD